MFGLEKNTPPKRFEFDLEKELKQSAAKTKEVLNQVEQKTQALKTTLRTGSADNFDQCGVILQAYDALKRVVNRTTRK